MDLGINKLVDMNVDSDMAVSMNWGSFNRGLRTPFKGLEGVDLRQVLWLFLPLLPLCSECAVGTS